MCPHILTYLSHVFQVLLCMMDLLQQPFGMSLGEGVEKGESTTFSAAHLSTICVLPQSQEGQLGTCV